MKSFRTISFFFLIFVVVGVSLLCIDFWVVSPEDKDSFLQNILVEAHGVLGDILIFGIILSIYETFRIKSERIKERESERVEKIKRHCEEIDDYRGWDEKEAMHRIAGNIKRLNKLEYFSINLDNCYLRHAELSGIIFDSSTFIEAELYRAKFSNVIFSHCNFSDGDFTETQFSTLEFRTDGEYKAEISDCKFNNATLRGASFVGVKLSNVNLVNAKLSSLYVTDENWIDGLDQESKKFVEDNYELMDSKSYNSGISDIRFDAPWADAIFLMHKKQAIRIRHENEKYEKMKNEKPTHNPDDLPF